MGAGHVRTRPQNRPKRLPDNALNGRGSSTEHNSVECPGMLAMPSEESVLLYDHHPGLALLWGPGYLKLSKSAGPGPAI